MSAAGAGVLAAAILLADQDVVVMNAPAVYLGGAAGRRVLDALLIPLVWSRRARERVQLLF